MGLRPARTFRDAEKVSWARFSRRRPRKSFVKSMPHNALNIYQMGNPSGEYEISCELVSAGQVLVRDNALESARQAVNKYLEKALPNQYFFKVFLFPHNVIRENKMIAGAGADRLQSGMAHPYGRPSERGATVKEGQVGFVVKAKAKDVAAVKEAYRRAKVKLSGTWRLEFTEIGKSS
jgi:large subunit ribosomal protein L10e